MPDPLDLERCRTFGITLRLHGDHLTADLISSMADEIARLRTIAAPLERLEAWLRHDPGLRTLYFDSFSPGGMSVRMRHGKYGDRSHAQRITSFCMTMPEAIAAAIDGWDAKYGKDAPHA